jgi:transposase
LVRARTALVNTARGLAKSYGERLRGCNVRNMNPEKAEELSPELQAALQPLLAALESLSEHIAEYNDRIENLAQQSYPQVALLKQVNGVGTLIALTFLLTLEDRIASARAATWAAIWGCSRDEETLGRASRRCTSARKATPICGRC